MKTYTYKLLLALIVLSITFSACEKVPLSTTDYSLPTDKALVRFALYSPSTPAVMIKINDVKINGNTTSGFGGIFPSIVNFPDYAAVSPGSTLKLSLPNTGTQNDSVVLFNSKLDVVAGKFYSVTLADTGVNRTAFSVEDQFLPQKDSFLSVRLINAMVGSTLNLIRVDSASATDVVRDTIARNISYKATSGFLHVRTLSTRPFIRIRIATNTGRNLGTPQSLAVGSRRSITFYATGFIDGSTTSLIPALSALITNQ